MLINPRATTAAIAQFTLFFMGPRFFSALLV